MWLPQPVSVHAVRPNERRLKIFFSEKIFGIQSENSDSFQQVSFVGQRRKRPFEEKRVVFSTETEFF